LRCRRELYSSLQTCTNPSHESGADPDCKKWKREVRGDRGSFCAQALDGTNGRIKGVGAHSIVMTVGSVHRTCPVDTSRVERSFDDPRTRLPRAQARTRTKNSHGIVFQVVAVGERNRAPHRAEKFSSARDREAAMLLSTLWLTSAVCSVAPRDRRQSVSHWMEQPSQRGRLYSAMCFECARVVMTLLAWPRRLTRLEIPS
jgi:hypothetical protein